MRSQRFLACLVVVAASVLAVPALAGQVAAQTDCWQTQPGTLARIPALAPGFFGPGCGAFGPASIPVVGAPLSPAELASCQCPVAPQTAVTWVDIHGDPVPAGSVHAVTQVPPGGTDTCVRRLADATFPGGIGVPDVVPIELVQLSLVSVAPIVVNCGGPTQWTVTIKENGVQPPGSMALTPSVITPLPAGTVTVPNLPVNFQFQFQQIAGPGLVSLPGSVNMQNPNPQAPGPPGTFGALFAVPALPGLGIASLALGAVLLVFALLWTRHRRALGNA